MIDRAKLNLFFSALSVNWQKGCKKHIPFLWTDVILRSYGQVLFADNPLTGICMISAIGIISSRNLFFSFLGAAIASVFAQALRKDKRYILHGIFGFTGVILGIFWSWYFYVTAVSVALFALMVVLAVLLQSAMMKLLSNGRFNLPVMSLPGALIFILFLSVSYALAAKGVSFPFISPGAETRIPAEPEGLLNILMSYNLHIWGIIFLGILINSRISFGSGLFFVTAGYVLTKTTPLFSDAGIDLFLGFNILPVAIAMFGVFIVAVKRAFLYSLIAFLLCSALILIFSKYLSPLYIPFLTLPFNLTVIALLIAARIINPEISGLFPVRLASVTTPEKILKEHETAYNNLDSLKFVHPFRYVPNPLSAKGESRQFLDIIKSADKISILSGAGTSTDSGIPDFRGNSGFWDNFSARDFTYQNFMADNEIRKRYWDMDRIFYRMVMESGPNETHRAAKRLEDMEKLACIVTQNVDGLFQQAGVDPAKVIEVHGTIHRARCINCAKSYRREDIAEMLNGGHEIPSCKNCNDHLKPETVLMGETLEKSVIGEALFRILTSDLLIVIGTSLTVDPVASIPDLAWQKGVKIIIINLSQTPKDGLADMIIRKNSAKFFKEILNYL